jgi:hypothetical protein
VRSHLAWWGALGVGLLVQTTLFSTVLPPLWTPDVTRAMTLWLALIGIPRGGVLLAFSAGLAVDLTSGAPPGFTAALRLGLYALARPLRGVFFENRPVLLFPFGALAAFADAAGAGLLRWLVFPTPLSLDILVWTAWHQALVDLIWVPAIFVGLEVVVGRRFGLEVPA